jgi:hypothetical protein
MSLLGVRGRYAGDQRGREMQVTSKTRGGRTVPPFD